MQDEPDVPEGESASEFADPRHTVGERSPRSGVVHPAAWSAPACGLAHCVPTSHGQRQAMPARAGELCVDGVDGSAYTALLEHLEELWRQVASVGATERAIHLLTILVVAPAAPGEASATRQGPLNRLLPQVRRRATVLDDKTRDGLVRIAELAGIEQRGIVVHRYAI